ncbi:MAG TPA: nucleotidyltransferase family protein [Gaiellaceae bacterium]
MRRWASRSTRSRRSRPTTWPPGTKGPEPLKAVILAAGYATRLYPLTLDQPKPLLQVGGRPILERLLEQLVPIEGLEEVYLVTNARFADHFREFAAARPGLPALRVVDDGSTGDENKLGAIGDLELVIRGQGLDDDLLVAAGDSIFTESLAGLVSAGLERQAPVIALYDVGDLEAIKRYSSIVTDEQGRIVEFEEKPERPRSSLAGVALYFYPRFVLPLVATYLAEGGNPDQPGRLVEWLYRRVPFYTWRVPGRWYDIGSKETLAQADREFSAG